MLIGQPAVGPLQVAVGDEVVELAWLAEPHLGERHEHRPGEVLVELGDRDVGRLHPGSLPELTPDMAVMCGGEAGFVERAGAVAMVEAVRAGDDRDGCARRSRARSGVVTTIAAAPSFSGQQSYRWSGSAIQRDAWYSSRVSGVPNLIARGLRCACA